MLCNGEEVVFEKPFVSQKCSLSWFDFFPLTLQAQLEHTNPVKRLNVKRRAWLFQQVGNHVQCDSAAVRASQVQKINWTESCSRLNTSGVGSVHDLIHLGSSEITLASLSPTCGLIFPIHVTFVISTLYFQQRNMYPIMDGCVRIQTEGHCFASFWNPTFSFFSSFLSTIFIASFSSVPSSPDANYWAMWPLM